LIYAYDIYFLEDNINTIKENTETILGASRDVGLNKYREHKVFDYISSSEFRTKPKYKDS
jgi:hypothetical protein